MAAFTHNVAMDETGGGYEGIEEKAQQALALGSPLYLSDSGPVRGSVFASLAGMRL